jgi:hypothetical protein
MAARIPEEHMVDVHVIRQDFARALSAYEADPGPATSAALEEQRERRARAMRSLHRDDNMGVREISAMFRTSKTATRAALAAETS